MNVRRPPGVVVIAPGVFTRPNSNEFVSPFGVRARMPAACEIGIEGSVVLIGCVKIAAGGVGLPNLDQCMRNGTIVLIKNFAGNDDVLPDRLAAVLVGQIETAGLQEVATKRRAANFGDGVWKANERFPGSALHGTGIWRVKIDWLGSGSGSEIFCAMFHAV